MKRLSILAALLMCAPPAWASAQDAPAPRDTTTQAQPDSETATEPGSATEPESESESESDSEPDSATEPESATETESEPDSATETESEPDSETESEPESETESEPESETEPESDPESDTEPEPESATEPEPQPAPPPASREPDAAVPSTNASAILGVVTVLSALATVTGLSWWIERDENVGRCAAYAMAEPRTRGCLNVGAIADQRDVGLGLFIGFGALTVGAAIAWAVVAATSPGPPPNARACGPGVLSFACTGRF